MVERGRLISVEATAQRLLRAVDVWPTDVILVTVPDLGADPPTCAALGEALHRCYPENLIVFVLDGTTIDTLDAAAMRKRGWVRADG